MSKLSETKTQDSAHISFSNEHPEQLPTSNDNRDSENQAVSNCDGDFECHRNDEESPSC